MEDVRRSAGFVLSRARDVGINEDALRQFAEELRAKGAQPVPWNACPFHHTGARKLDFIFAIDALNFCFWPTPGFEYDTLGNGLKAAMMQDELALSPERLSSITESSVSESLFHSHAICLLDERTRLLRQLGANVTRLYGSYEALVAAANKSAETLVELITAALPGFRDTAIYEGRQVFFYKRAQILVADIWGAFEGRGIGEFNDIESLTMFADYRVPQLLRHHGVLRYSQSLSSRIDSLEELPSGCREEVEIRAATIKACDELRALLNLRTAVETDWLLWQRGEECKSLLSPHHRTLSIFY